MRGTVRLVLSLRSPMRISKSELARIANGGRS